MEDPKTYFSQETPFFAETIQTQLVQVSQNNENLNKTMQEKLSFGEFYSEILPSRLSESQLHGIALLFTLIFLLLFISIIFIQFIFSR